MVLQELPMELPALLEPLQSPHQLHMEHLELPELPMEPAEPLEPPELLMEPAEPLDLPADQESLVKPPPPHTKESPTLEDQESVEADTHIKPKNTDFLKSIFDYL